jgi:RNA polymerase sigma factor (sigma-70 family)
MADATGSPVNPPRSVTGLLGQMRAGSTSERDEAAAAIVRRYFAQVADVVGRNLSPRLRRRIDPEDLALATFQSVCLRLADGQFKLDDRNDFWQLLVRIALNKTRKEATAQMTRKRDLSREVHSDGASSESVALLLDGRAPTPEEAAIMAEEMARLLEKLPVDIRPIAVWKFEGYTSEEIAAKLGYTLRTVERKLRLIRQKWAGVAR